MTYFSSLARVALRRATKRMRGPNLGRFLEGFAAALDGDVAALRTGLTFSNPLLCPVECLPAISRDRGIPIWPQQSEESQRAMLADWLNLHRLKGSHEGVLRMVRHYFEPGPFPRLWIVHQSGDGASCEWSVMTSSGAFTTTRATPSNWNFDPHSDQWARWWLGLDDTADDGSLRGVSSLIQPAFWDDGSLWDEGHVWDGVYTRHALNLLGMALAWKRAGTRLQGIVVNRVSQGAPVIGPSSTVIVDPQGWTSLPISNWGRHGVGLAPNPARPPYLNFLYEA